MNILLDSCNESQLPGAGTLLIQREDDLNFLYIIGFVEESGSKFKWTLTRLHDGNCWLFVSFEDLIHLCQDIGLTGMPDYTITES